MRILVMMLVLALSTGAVHAADSVRRIMVSGSGEVLQAPDMAQISLGVVHEAKTAGAAMDAVSAATRAVLERLRALGIDDKDIQTSGLSLQPVWNHAASNQRPRIVGFSAANTVTLRVRDLGRLGHVLDAVIRDGANQMHGLQFGLQDPDPVRDEARRRAVADAMGKAALLADAAGVTLGDVLEMSEEGGGRPRPMMMEAAMRSGGGDVPIAAGELATQAQVRMVFAIGD